MMKLILEETESAIDVVIPAVEVTAVGVYPEMTVTAMT